jgi:hypothetical protein
MECCWSPGTQQKIYCHASGNLYNILGKGLIPKCNHAVENYFLNSLVTRRVMGQIWRELSFLAGIYGAEERGYQQQCGCLRLSIICSVYLEWNRNDRQYEYFPNMERPATTEHQVAWKGQRKRSGGGRLVVGNGECMYVDICSVSRSYTHPARNTAFLLSSLQLNLGLNPRMRELDIIPSSPSCLLSSSIVETPDAGSLVLYNTIHYHIK